MSRLAPFLASLRSSLQAYADLNQPVPVEVIGSCVRILQLSEKYVADLEARLDPAIPFEAENVVFLDAWLRQRSQPTETPKG